MTFGRFFSATAGAAALVIVASATGCYVDSAPQQRAVQSGAPPLAAPTDDAAGVCQTTFSKGCFDGYIIANKEFVVDGKQFFNADELSSRFKELVTVDAKDFELALTTKVDNQSFLQGFEYNLTGPLVKTGTVRSNGSFAVENLPEGQYDLRVQRAVRFSVSHKVVRAAPAPASPTPVAPTTTTAGSTTMPPATPGTTPAAPGTTPATPVISVDPVATTTVTQTFCATIYSDKTLDIRRGTRLLPETFADFRLHVTDSVCDATGDNATISLRD